jgi:hypothetical protein
MPGLCRASNDDYRPSPTPYRIAGPSQAMTMNGPHLEDSSRRGNAQGITLPSSTGQ